MSDELGDFLRRDELANRAQRAAAGVAVARSDGINGDAAAQQAQLARRYGVSPEIVAANPKIFQQRSETDDFNYHTQRQPKLADFIGYDEHRAAMMKDDIGNSAGIASLFDEHGRDRGWDTALAAPNSFYNITQGLSAPLRGVASFLNYLTDDSERGFIPQVKAGRSDLTLANVARSMGAGVLDMGAGAMGAIEAGTNFVAKYNPLSNAERYLFGTSEFDIAGNAFTKTRHSLSGWADELAPKTTTTAGEGILSGVRSIPTSVGAFAAGSYFRSAKVAVVLMGGIVGGQSYGKGRDEGLGVEHALAYGAIDAGIEALTEYLPEKYLIGHVGANSPFIKRFLGSMLREVPGEQAATILQDFNQWVNIDASKGKTFQDYLDERPHAALTTLIATAVTTGAINTALSGTEYVANKLGKTLARAQAAETTAPFLERMAELSKASKLAKRDAGTFGDFVKMAAEGSDATHVYVDAKELVNVLEQSDIKPEDVAKLTGKTIAELHQSAIRGDDIQIPIEQFAAQIAPVEALSSKLIPHLRINPEEMSATEAKTFMQGAMDELSNEAEKHFTGMENADEARQSMDRVRESFAGQLADAGRFTNEVNASYATMIASFYAATGARAGLNAEQMAERYPLRVQSESPVEPAKRTLAQKVVDKVTGRQVPLQGLPERSLGVYAPARQAAQSYAKQAGIEYSPPARYALVDESRAKRIAQAFDDMKHAPNDPAVRASYDAMIKETLAQWGTIKQTGLKVEFIEGEDPYKGSPMGAVRDVRENNHLWVFNTEDGYGQSGITPAEEANNPMLAIVPGETWSGKPVRVNDIFRVVHDYFGHIKEGVGFRAAGEENAWRIHSAMYSPLARKAMTTETRGQNSWLNYGPHGEANRTAKVGDTVFAEQKIGLMPDWVSEEGAHDDSMQGVLQQATMLRAERAAWSDQRLDGLIREYGYSFNDESKGWAVMMSPDQFLGLTLSEKGRKQIAEGVANPANDYEGGVINPERLAAAGPIMLSVHLAQGPSDLQKSMGVVALDNRISGHEGRHRMTMLKAAGVEQVPVLLIPREGKVKAPLASLDLAPQRSRSDQLATGDTRTTISNAIPLNHQYRDQLRAMTRGTDPAVLFQSATFYSALARAVDTSNTKRAPAAQWIATLKKAPGVKQEELEWSGILDFLADQESADIAAISQDQLSRFLSAGGIKTDEVLLGDPARNAELIQELMDEGQSYEEASDIGPDTQFASWSSDPNNDTYRELLITLPLGEGKNPSRAPSTHWDTEGVVAHARFMDKVDADGNKVLFIEEVQSDWHQKGRDQGYLQPVDKATIEPAQAKYDIAQQDYLHAVEVSEPLVRAAHEALLPVAEKAIGINVAAVDKSKLSMPVEEFVGLLERSSGVAELRNKAGSVYADRLDKIFSNFVTTTNANSEGQPLGDLSSLAQMIDAAVSSENSERAALHARDLAGRELDIAKGLITNGGIPNAPFKSSWPALVMKRMIRYAADHGYSRIAWTTGEQQADRYNLSTAVGILTYKVQDDGRVRVNTQDDRGYEALRQYGEMGPAGSTFFTREQAEQTFGREIASKMWAGEGGEPDSTGHRKLEGSDLRVGGEGMKAFYDRNLVNITNDLIKRHGAKVEKVILSSELISQIEGAIRATTPETERLFNRDLGAQLERAKVAAQQPGFEITDALANAAKSGFALFQNTGSPRGQIAFGGDITQEPSVITLLRGADLSTFLHESGHFFLEVLTDMSGRADAPAGVLGDMKALLDFFGVDSLTKWQEMSIEERRDHHEKFARGFEAYLFEGKAPSIEMRSLFTRFRNWLKNVYRSLAKLNVTLTDEVRGVFDRMLASEEAIAEAQTDLELTPFFDMKPEGMSDVDWTEYQSLGQQATSEAESQLEQRSLRDMRYAGRAAAIELKRLQKEVAGQRAAMRDEVTQDLIRQPVYRAITWLRTGQIDGEDVEGPHKLNTPDVRAILQLGDAPIPDSLKGFTSSKDGVNPEQVAELFGYGSADQMIKDMLFAAPLDQAVEAETDSRMRERYGELNSPEALKAAVEAAVHNTVRGRFVATELAALENAPGKVRALTTAAKRIADSMIAQLKIRDVRPAQYEAAERRAAKDAQKAGTAKLAEAAAAKRNQLLQFHAAKAAHAAIEEIDKARKYLGKFNKQSTRDAIDPDYRDQIDAILEKLDLRTGISNKEAERRKSLAEWIKQQEDMGFEPAFDAEMIDAIGRTPFRELYVEEMRGIVDAVRNIEHLGRVTKRLMTAIDKASLAQAADEVAATVHENAFKTHKAIIGSKTWFEHVKSGLDDFLGMHRKFAMIARMMDGEKDGGPVWERFVRGMNAAGDAEASMNRDATIALAALFKPLKNTMKRVFIPEINASLRLEDRLMVALNWGNGTNRQRIADGDKWTDEQVGAILAPLTAEHWDFVEGVWRYIDSFWPQVVAKQRRVTGVEPVKVEAEPFQIEVNGELRLIRGGYFPIKYDPDRSTKAEADNDAEIAKGIMRGAYSSATTRRGHIKERVDSVKRPVRKDFGVIFQHIGEVVHDLTHHEWLIDANRLLKTSAVDSAIRESYGPATLRWMRKALEDIAAGDLGAHNALERSVNYLRQGATIAGLGWNLTTALFQPLGLAQSMVRIGPQWVGKGILEIFSNPLKMNAKMQWIYSRSAFMRGRSDTMQREINEIRNKIAPRSPMRKSLDAVIPQPLTDAVGASYFYLIGKMQLIADVPTWIGQYEKSMAAGRDEDTAVALADQAVLDAQGGGQTKDLAGVQRGNVWLKLWTNFYSYFSVTQNMMANRVGKLRRVGVKDLPFFAVDTLLLTAVPATMTVLLRAGLAALGGGEPPDDDLAKKIAQENLNTWLGMFIGLREAQALVSDNQSYNGPAGARVISEAKKLAEQAKQGEIDEAFLRSLNSTAGVLLHYPAGQVDRTARGLEAMSDGKAGVGAAIVGPPPKKH